jgi:hypothetical protein
MPFNGDDVWRPEPTWFNTGAGIDVGAIFLGWHHMAKKGFIIPQIDGFHTLTSTPYLISTKTIERDKRENNTDPHVQF